ILIKGIVHKSHCACSLSGNSSSSPRAGEVFQEEAVGDGEIAAVVKDRGAIVSLVVKEHTVGHTDSARLVINPCPATEICIPTGQMNKFKCQRGVINAEQTISILPVDRYNTVAADRQPSRVRNSPSVIVAQDVGVVLLIRIQSKDNRVGLTCTS